MRTVAPLQVRLQASALLAACALLGCGSESNDTSPASEENESSTSEDWSTAESVMVEWPRGLTDVVSTPEGLYLLNGQAIQFALGQDPLGPFTLSRFTGEF